jgi:protein O-mannosyl-transferase
MSRRSGGKQLHANHPAGRSASPADPGDRTRPPGTPSHPRWLSLAICLLLAAAVWAVFGQTVHDGFVNYDDNIYVYDNPGVTHGLSGSGVSRAFTRVDHFEWLPLTRLSHMLDCQLYGLRPGGHHLTNVLLHLATTILLFLVLRNMTGAPWRSAFVAAMFAIHPLRAESVAWVTERKDVLSGLFFMLALWAYVHHVQRSAARSARSRSWYLLALGLFALGLMSKATVVTLPFVLLLLDYWPLRRLMVPGSRVKITPLVLEKLPFLLLAGIASVITLLAASNVGSVRAVQDLTLPYRLGNALAAYIDYLAHMLYPARLAVAYPRPGIHLSVVKVGLSLLVLILVSAGVMAGRRKHPYLPVGWLWYLGMLVPVIDIMQAGDQSRADRHTYLPEIGLSILITWGAVELCSGWRHRRAVLGVAAVATVAGLLVLARMQTAYWKDSVSLWSHTLACTSDNYIAHNNLGSALSDQGKWNEAIRQYEQALRIKPDFADAQYNLGLGLAAQGKLDEAIRHYELALRIKPDYVEAHASLGAALVALEKFDEAVPHYERALQLSPNGRGAAVAHNNLGYALSRQGNLAGATEQYQQALLLDPGSAMAHINLGNALFAQGKWNESIEHYERTIQLSPNDANAQINISMALVNRGTPEAALPHLQQALNLAIAQNNAALAESIRTRLSALQSALSRSPGP